MADTLSSTRRRTQRCSSPNSNCITPPASPPPALPLSPTSTAEYWDHALEKHLKERRTRRASKSSRHSRHHNRAALDMISSHEEDDMPVPNQDDCSASSFDLGFPERDRADSAHETEGVVESLKCPKEARRQTSSQTLRVFPSNNKRASGRRREGQTLASPTPLSPTQRPKTSADKSSSSSSSPQRRKCPPRPPRPDDEILFIPSLCSAAQSSASRSNRSSASRGRRFTESIPENSIAEAITPPRSSHSSPSMTVSAAPKSSFTSVPSPPMTPVHTAHFALHQTVSVWDSDDSDDEEDEGLLRYVRRTLHASKSSMSGRTSSERDNARQKSSERTNTSTGSEREKSSDDDSSDAKLRSSRRRRRRSTMREAVIRVFGCA